MRKMMLLGGAALLTVLAGVAMAQPQGGAPRGDRGRFFELLDADRDGRVTAAELAAFVQARFDAADTDKDGRLSLAEARAISFRPQPAGTQPAQAGRGAERRAERAEALFRGVDADRDGFVTLADVRPAAETMFRMADRNADGAVERTELRRHGGRR